MHPVQIGDKVRHLIPSEKLPGPQFASDFTDQRILLQSLAHRLRQHNGRRRPIPTKIGKDGFAAAVLKVKKDRSS
jgi:hypothetical protein